jgi:hypothetical protein
MIGSQELLQGAGAVAGLVFDGGAEFGIGLVVAERHENRVVAEALDAAGSWRDAAVGLADKGGGVAVRLGEA